MLPLSASGRVMIVAAFLLLGVIPPAPEITLSDRSLDFGAIINGTSILRTLTVTNTGTETVPMGPLSTDHAAFSARYQGGDDQGGFDLPPDSSRKIIVTFSPSATGTSSGVLRITSSLPVQAVALTGEAQEPPVIVVDSDELEEELDAGAQTTRTITISNTGASDLTWSIASSFATEAAVVRKSPTFGVGTSAPGMRYRFEAPLPMPLATVAAGSDRTPLETILANLRADSASVVNSIPNRFDFYEGETGSSIGDGGNDMYDGGNALRTNLTYNYLPYTNGIVQASSAWGTEGRYFTQKLPGLFVLGADLDGVSEFIIEGDLGADGAGNVDGSILTMSVHNVQYVLFVKRVYESGDPSVNHVIIIEHDADANHEFDTYPEGDYHRVFNLGGTDRLYYLLFGGENGFYYDDDTVLSIAKTFISALGLQPPWLTVSPEAGTTSAGTSTNVTVTLDATGLVDSTYVGELLVQSNDLEQPVVAIPVALQVHGAPRISVAADTLDFGAFFTGLERSLTLTVTNTGSDQLEVEEPGIDPAAYTVTPAEAFSLNPGEEHELTVTFAPSAAGAQPGTLTLTSNDPNQPALEVRLLGEGLEPPVAAATPDRFDVMLDAGQTATQTLTLANDGGSDLTYEIRAHRSRAAQPTMAKAEPDSGALFALDYNTNLLSRLNPATGAVIDTLRSGLANDGADGLAFDGDILYLKQNDGAYITRFDPDTGAIVDSLSLPDSLRDGIDGLAHSGTWLYAVAYYPNRIYEIDPQTGMIHRTIYPHTESGPADVGFGLTYGGTRGTLFAGSQSPSIIYELDPETGAVLNQFQTPDWTNTLGLGYSETLELLFVGGGSSIWAMLPDDGALHHQFDGYFDIFALAADEAGIPRFLQIEPDEGTVAAQGTEEVTLTFDATNLVEGTYAADVVVTTNDPAQPSLTVPAVLTVDGTPVAEVTPAALDFGSIFAGVEKVQALTLTNTGTAPLPLNGFTLTDGPFALRDTIGLFPLTLGPGKTRTLNVVFAPDSADTYMATLTLTSGDDEQADIAVALQGEGGAPPVAGMDVEAFTLSISRNQAATRTLTLTNTGRSEMTFDVQVRRAFVTGTAKAASPPDTTVRVQQRVFLDPPEVLLIQNWDVGMETFIQDRFGFRPSVINSDQIASTDFSAYDLIITTGDQNWSYYQALSNEMDRFEAYVTEGGLVQYHLATSGETIQIVGGVTAQYDYLDEYSTVELPDHAVAEGLPHRFRGFNRTYFNDLPDENDLPDGAVVITRAENGDQATTVEYPYGNGLVLATGMPWEYLYQENFTGGQMLVNATTYMMEGAGTDWIAVEPQQGTVAPEASVELTITFNADADLEVGVYEAMILVETNDPQHPLLELAVQLTATEAVAVDEAPALPTAYALRPNYPNPFNPVTTIPYDVPEAGPVTLEVFDALGRRVVRLLDGPQPAGYHTLSFDARALPSGIYFYRLQAGDFSQVRRMVLLK